MQYILAFCINKEGRVQIIIFCLMMLSFIGGGIAIREFKMYDLIAGYNTLPPDEKIKYDISSVANKVGLMLYFFAILTAIFGAILFFANFSKQMQGFITLSYVVIIFIIINILTININKDHLHKTMPVLIFSNVIVIIAIVIVIYVLIR